MPLYTADPQHGYVSVMFGSLFASQLAQEVRVIACCMGTVVTTWLCLVTLSTTSACSVCTDNCSLTAETASAAPQAVLEREQVPASSNGGDVPRAPQLALRFGVKVIPHPAKVHALLRIASKAGPLPHPCWAGLKWPRSLQVSLLDLWTTPSRLCNVDL